MGEAGLSAGESGEREPRGETGVRGGREAGAKGELIEQWQLDLDPSLR